MIPWPAGPRVDGLVIWAVKLPTLMGGALAVIAALPSTVEEGLREARRMDREFGPTGWRHVVGHQDRPPFR